MVIQIRFRTAITVLSLIALSSIFYIGQNSILSDLSQADQEDRRPNVIMISLDTLRPDHMPCYGYQRNTTPFLCSFAEENIVFEEAIAQAPWTLPSQASVFTSKYPMFHETVNTNSSLSSSDTTLAEVLESNGYETAAFVTGNEKSGLGHYNSEYNLDQGFETYNVGDMKGNSSLKTFDERRSINVTSSKALKWLDKKERERFYLFLQGYDVHDYGIYNPQIKDFSQDYSGFFANKSFDPYAIERESQNLVYRNFTTGQMHKLSSEDIEYVIDRYDRRVRYADQQMKSFFDKLEERDVYKNTIIIFYAGHGTNLADHLEGDRSVTGHGSLHDYNLRVPLIMRVPGEKNNSVKQQVELIDLMPTILELADIDKDSLDLQGRSLVNDLSGEKTVGVNYAFSQSTGYDRTSIRTENWKYTVPTRYIGSFQSNDSDAELFNLKEDENELNNVHDVYPDKKQRLEEELENWKLYNYRSES